jgi:hypothetical protein
MPKLSETQDRLIEIVAPCAVFCADPSREPFAAIRRPAGALDGRSFFRRRGRLDLCVLWGLLSHGASRLLDNHLSERGRRARGLPLPLSAALGMDHAPRCDVDKFRYISWHHGNCERTDDVRVLLSGVKNGAGYDDTNGIHGSDAVSCLCFGLSRHKASVKRKSATDNRFVLGPAWHRARPRRTPLGGGAAMALAAAIKLYPVIFALLWLAAGRKQSVVRFAILGGALGLVSLAVGGWPQHAAFLSELHAISSSAVITFPNVTMDSLLAVLLIDPASTELITTEATGGKTSWRIFAKPALWQGMNVIVQLTTISLLTVFSIRTRLADPLVWPVIFVALAWVLPLSWLYHYLTAFAFLPALVARLGWKRGIYAMSVPALVTSTAFFVLTLSLPAVKTLAYPVMGGAMVWMGLVFLWATRQSAWKPPLRTTSQRL